MVRSPDNSDIGPVDGIDNTRLDDPSAAVASLIDAPFRPEVQRDSPPR